MDPCPNCGADWRRTEIISAANHGGGYRIECHACGHKYDDVNASHHERETARRQDLREAQALMEDDDLHG